MNRHPRTWSLTVAVAIAAGCAAGEPAFDEARLMVHIETLSSDEFGGRAPGSPGERKTVGYLTGVFEELGLEPGNPAGRWVQPVPLVGSTATVMEASSDVRGAWEPGTDFVAWTKRVVPETEASGELLFVGYGWRLRSTAGTTSGRPIRAAGFWSFS